MHCIVSLFVTFSWCGLRNLLCVLDYIVAFDYGCHLGWFVETLHDDGYG